MSRYAARPVRKSSRILKSKSSVEAAAGSDTAADRAREFNFMATLGSRALLRICFDLVKNMMTVGCCSIELLVEVTGDCEIQREWDLCCIYYLLSVVFCLLSVVFSEQLLYVMMIILSDALCGTMGSRWKM